MSTPEEKSNLSSPSPDVEVEDGLEIHADDEIADDEPGDDEDEATKDLPSDEYDGSQDQVDRPG